MDRAGVQSSGGDGLSLAQRARDSGLAVATKTPAEGRRLPAWIAQVWWSPVEIASVRPSEPGTSVWPYWLDPQQKVRRLPAWIAQVYNCPAVMASVRPSEAGTAVWP